VSESEEVLPEPVVSLPPNHGGILPQGQ
jgi:hypothetical protein